MSETPAIKRIQQFAAKLNSGDIESIRHYMSDSYFNYAPQIEFPKASDVYYEVIFDLKNGMSDLHVELADLVEIDDLVTGVLTLSGTTDGPLWGAPATNRLVSWTVSVSIRQDSERFAINFDDVSVPEAIGVLRQMDLVPPPEQMDRPHYYPVVIPEVILQVLFNGSMDEKVCDHMHEIRVSKTELQVCESCVELGDQWPALRMCLICGFVGCCDTSKNKHMKGHFEETGHGLFRSVRLNEGWGWCYDHDAFFSARTLEQYYPPAQ